MYEKLKEIFAACRKAALFLIPAAGIFELTKWFFNDYIPSRAKQLFEWLLSFIPTESLSLSPVSVDWSRINQWFPVNESISYGAKFIACAGAIAFIKWMGKMMPFSAGK
jgi:hypothetical protein